MANSLMVQAAYARLRSQQPWNWGTLRENRIDVDTIASPIYSFKGHRILELPFGLGMMFGSGTSPHRCHSVRPAGVRRLRVGHGWTVV